ncbi:hypothetical protein G6F50_013075 [Rhizopus delemar]|uniref:Major facilitator superfamily (MFS) profile domain-containing protein n=1 Tax=Rhizopus delemar TaxID=936053 RepID=A0A9P6YNC8_9FUNG|nr:hypothetical protein G6F50_013075 [Rhizopus delemar]
MWMRASSSVRQRADSLAQAALVGARPSGRLSKARPTASSGMPTPALVARGAQAAEQPLALVEVQRGYRYATALGDFTNAQFLGRHHLTSTTVEPICMTTMLSPADTPVPADTSILSARYRATTIGMVALVALHAFEALAVAAAMPTVAEALDGLRLYALAFGGTLATSVIGMTLAGRWADRHGPARPLWYGLACFVLGLLLAGFAMRMGMLVAGRLLQGLGAGAISVSLLGGAVDDRPGVERPDRAASGLALGVPGGAAAGGSCRPAAAPGTGAHAVHRSRRPRRWTWQRGALGQRGLAGCAAVVFRRPAAGPAGAALHRRGDAGAAALL